MVGTQRDCSLDSVHATCDRKALSVAKRQLEAVLNAASELSIIATDRDGLITIFNHGAEKMLGYSAAEMVGKQTPLMIHLPSEVEQRSQELSLLLGRPVEGFRIFVENARISGAERLGWTYIRKDGSRLKVNLTVTIINDEDGNISGFLGIAEDVTCKTMERQLQESEELLHTIINAIPNPIFYKDSQGIYTGCNDAFCEYLGLPREKIINATVYDIAPRKLAEIYDKADLELISRGGTQRYETTVPYADNSMHDVLLYKSTLSHEKGSVRGLVGVMLDITDLKQVEKELRQKEELFHLLFEKSGDANLLIDGTAIIDCNEATVRMLGYPDKHHIINLNPGNLSPDVQPDGRPSVEKANEMMLCAYERGSCRFEWQHRRADDTTLPVEVMLTAIPMHGRWLLHTAWRDLTERKRAEEEKEKLTQSLLHAQKIESIGRLAGGVAHDFNNLLTPVLGYAEMLRKSCQDDETNSRRIDGILNAAGKARDLTRQLLAFGRKQVLEMRVTNLNQVIDAFTFILERTIRENIRIDLKLDPQLGSMMADHTQIEQIIMNLAINAQDAMPTGGTLLIETSNVKQPDQSGNAQHLPPGVYVKLVVSDTGCGMDHATLDHIFEPFYTTKDPGKGTGLGLATVFGIVKQHGGHINVYSEPGHGSCFTLYFPGLNDFPAAAETPAEPAAIPVHSGVTILLVEDNSMVREMVRELLTDQGYRVLVAEESRQARTMMEEHRNGVDLLLSDVILPGISGPALYELLQPLKADLKVIFMSGYNENIVAQQYALRNSSNYIQKPFSSQALLLKIHEVLNQHSAETASVQGTS